MENQALNLYIVDDNKSMVAGLKQFLQNKFGFGVNISTFYDGESALEKVNSKTDIVILDYFMKGKNGLEVLKSIKKLNPETKVIMLSSNEDIGLAIESFKEGATDYVVKGETSWDKLTRLITHIVTTPIRLMVREFGVSKFMAIFIMTFTTMGIVVAAALEIWKDWF